nr:hypothetical protein [Staphylococcus haemolyticus]
MVSTTGARTLASFTIPDPGYAYTPWIFGHVLAKSDGNWSMPRIDVLNASSARVAIDRKSTRLNSSHMSESRIPSSA